MSFKEKRNIVTILSAVILLIIYIINVSARRSMGALALTDSRAWAQTILVFIAVFVVSMIVILVTFHILASISIAVKERIADKDFDESELEDTIQSEMCEDEMDRTIQLKSSRSALTISGVGFVAGLLALLFNQPVAVMLNIQFISGIAGAIVESLVQIYYYRRGV